MPLNQQSPKNYRLIKIKNEKERKGLEDVATLKKLLESRGHNDLAMLIEGCTSEVEESSQYGSYLFSVISTFWIYAPPEKIEKLEQISEKDKNLLLELVKKIYPLKKRSPEIEKIEFRVLTIDLREQKSKDKQSQNQLSQTMAQQQKRKKKSFSDKYFTPIIIATIATVFGGIILAIVLNCLDVK